MICSNYPVDVQVLPLLACVRIICTSTRGPAKKHTIDLESLIRYIVFILLCVMLNQIINAKGLARGSMLRRGVEAKA